MIIVTRCYDKMWPIFSKSSQKSFYLKSDMFKRAKKLVKYLGYVRKKIFVQDLFK